MAFLTPVVLETAGKVSTILNTLSDILRKNDPDLTAARVQVNELQQATYQLQMEN